MIALMMGAASSSETSVDFYRTARHNNLKTSHHHTRRRENLQSHHKIGYFPGMKLADAERMTAYTHRIWKSSQASRTLVMIFEFVVVIIITFLLLNLQFYVTPEF
jgi:hypothetical protein